MKLFKPEIDKAREALAASEAQLASWEAIQVTRQAELEDLLARVGGELLAAGEEGLSAATESVSRLRAEIDVAGRALGDAVGDVVTARRTVLTAAATSLRRRADELRSEAAKHRRRTEQLLDELEEHEGVRYSTATTALVAGGTASTVVNLPTRSDALDAEADALIAKAAEADAAAADRSLTAEGWAALMVRLDPEGPEAAAHARRWADHEAIEQQARDAGAAAIQRRKDWLDQRADEILASRGRHDEVHSVDGKRRQALQQARAELDDLRRRAPEGTADTEAWALDRLAAAKV